YSTTYYWRVATIAPGDTSRWSTIWSFTTGGIDLTLSVNVGVMQAAGVFDSTKDAVIVRGDFEHFVNPTYQDWVGNQFHLAKSAANDSVYNISFQLNGASAGDTIQYKFLVMDTSNGQASLSDLSNQQGTWETDRTAPGPNGNRIYVLGSANTQSLPTVYFDNMFGPVQTHNITFQADLTSLKLAGFNGRADSISVRGSWPPLTWSSDFVILPSANNPNIYMATARITMPVGGILEYRFFGSPSGLFENYGWDTASSNRMINFPDHDTTLPAVDPAIYLIRPAKKLNLAWKIGISADANGFVDSSSYAAVDTGASDGYDSLFDLPKPPQSPANYIYVYFPHPGWDVPLGPNFMTDVRHDTDLTHTAQVWTFVVATDQKNKNMTLTLSASGDSLLSYPIMLKDMKTGAVSDVRSTPIHTYNTGTDSARVFQLIVGTPFASVSHSYNPGWNMVGLPLTSNQSDMSTLFGSSAYIFGYSGGSYFAPETLEEGEGYWLGITSPVTVKTSGVQLLDKAGISLSPGFNMISVPFFDSSYFKAQLSVTKGNVTVSLDSAAALGWISPSLYSYEQSVGSYSEPDTLSAWSGYWFAALDSNLTLVFNPPANTFIQSAAKKAPAKQREAVAVVSDSDWIVHIGLSAGNSADELGAFGIKPGAMNGFDPRYDFPHPPSPPSSGQGYAYLIFPHPEWRSVIGSDFSTDVQPAPASSPWKIIVGYTAGKTMATLSWDSASVPAGLSVELTDLGNGGNSIDMGRTGIYRFPLDGIDSLLISGTLTGINDIAPVVPKQFALDQNYPNPFNPSTTISFDLKETSNVTLEIFNVLGQRVLDEKYGIMNAGEYRKTINMSDFSSGVYFYRLIANGNNGERFVAIKKLLLLK
ncbi:MAG: T9SS type A sorting domain-containing protein, partial [Bacteroidetes bacterium]|nr:T9SS type A sorting domain-containing protein [Bacteroidota bacterium]